MRLFSFSRKIQPLNERRYLIWKKESKSEKNYEMSKLFTIMEREDVDFDAWYNNFDLEDELDEI